MNIKYSIIIPSYRQHEELQQCLIALSQQVDIVACEILVVYHMGDVPDTLMNAHRSVRWIINENAPNPYQSRNLGAQHALGAYFCFIDAKCIPRNNWLSQLDNYIHQVPEAQVLAGQISVNSIKDDLYDVAHGLLYLNNKKNVERGYGAPAGHLIIHHDVFTEFGGFDTRSVSGNDIIYTRRLLTAGVDIHYVHQVIVDYEGLPYDLLKVKMRKYAKGVVKHKNITLKQILSGFFPMRPLLFLDNLAYRNMQDLTIVNKLKLWIILWQLKVYYTAYIIQAQLHRCFGAFDDKG